MRVGLVAATAAFAGLFSHVALADDSAAQLSAMCMKGAADTQASCDCQAKLIVDNGDPRYIQVLVAMANGKSGEDAMKQAGITMDDFNKMSQEADAKTKSAMEACKALK